ncbi:MAG: hypothetical protein WEB58_11435 [Planctomycetaceae bacterium]
MTNHHEIEDWGDDLRITKINRRESGTGIWVEGELHGHRFQGLVFAAHAECPDYELYDSRISKLWLQRLSDRVTVANFDRGWDIMPQTDEAKGLVDFLCAGLADAACGCFEDAE